MSRDYIDLLETLPCNRKRQKLNVWMGSWGPLPDVIDLLRNPKPLVVKPYVLACTAPEQSC